MQELPLGKHAGLRRQHVSVPLKAPERKRKAAPGLPKTIETRGEGKTWGKPYLLKLPTPKCFPFRAGGKCSVSQISLPDFAFCKEENTRVTKTVP